MLYPHVRSFPSRHPFKTLLAALFLAASSPALAVEQTGELTGIVRDEQKQPMPGVLVNLKGENLQGERAVSTNAKGEFAFRLLPPGPYTLRYTAPGYEVIEQSDVVVNIGRVTSLTVELRPGTTENVTVIGSVPLVDTTRTSTQDNYTIEYLEKTQVGSGGRSYQSVLQNSAGTGPGDGANPTVRGATLGENSYLIDGVDSTDPVTATFGTNFIFDAIQEIQFLTGGFAAEFGHATGGISNVVTKSGGNEIAGTFDARYRNQDFIEKGDHFTPDEVSLQRQIFEGTIGGPIIKDKLWYFVAGSYNRDDFQPSGAPTSSNFDGRYYLGKLTWQINPAHKLQFQVTGDPATIDNVDSSVLVAKKATTKQTQGSNFLSLQWQASFSPDLLLQAQVAHYASQLDAEPQRGDFTTIGNLDFLTGELTSNAIDAQYSDRYREQANATLTWHVPKGAGEHTFKFGVDVQALKFEFEQFTPGGEYDDVAPDPNGVNVPLFYNETIPAGRLDNDGIVQAYFAQDEWRIHPRFTLNAGLRYDTYSYNDDRGSSVIDASLLQPRVGVAWDTTGDAKNVLKAYGGIFAHPSLLALPRVLNTRANLLNLSVNEEIACWAFADPSDPNSPCPGFGPFPIDTNGDAVIDSRAFFASFGGPGGSVVARDGHLDATNVLEYSLAYERQFTNRTFAGLTLVHRRTRDIIEDEFDFASGLYIIDNVPELTRNHYGAELRFATQVQRLHLWSSYSYGLSRGNIEYTQSLGTDWDFPWLTTNRYGWLSDDARHTVRANGFYDLPWKLQMGYAYLFQTGVPQSRVRSAPIYGEEFIRPRGYLRGPTAQQLDLDLRKSWALGKTTIQGIITVTNVFDTEIVTSVNQLDPNLQAIGYQIPRRYEIGVRYLF